ATPSIAGRAKGSTTALGWGCGVSVPSPTIPPAPPQHRPCPSTRTAQVAFHPTVTAATSPNTSEPASASTGCGRVAIGSDEPVPSRPSALRPQQFTVPSCRSAQVLAPPAATCTAPGRGPVPAGFHTATGRLRVDGGPAPSPPCA